MPLIIQKKRIKVKEFNEVRNLTINYTSKALDKELSYEIESYDFRAVYFFFKLTRSREFPWVKGRYQL